jgi:hypothetical protein
VPDLEDSKSPVERSIDPCTALIGQKAQGCWIGYGSTLFLEFGEPQPVEELQHHANGEWSLRCDQIIVWRIEQGDSVLAGSEDDRETMESAIQKMNGRTLVSAEISLLTGDALLEFSDDLLLKTFAEVSDEIHWACKHRTGDGCGKE